MSTTTTQQDHREYKGSCHCGTIKYLISLQLPPAVLSGPTSSSEMTASSKTPSVRLRKCNCTVCHKMGFFHVRVPFAPTDFSLLSPLNPLEELGDYKCYDEMIHWLFCQTCGVRCFAFIGEGEIVERDVEGKKVEVWKPKREGWEEGKRWEEGKGCYLSVNAHTLDAGQEGLDLREWHEKGWIHYLDTLDEKEDDQWGKPHRGGCY